MKKYILLLFTILNISCQNKPDAVNGSTTVDNTSKRTSEISYCYIVLTTVEPNIITNDNGEKMFNWDVKIYTSHLQEIPNLTEEIEYKYLDEYADNIRKTNLVSANAKFEAMLDIYNLNIKKEEGKVATKKFYKFNTYKEASIERDKVLINPNNYDPNI